MNEGIELIAGNNCGVMDKAAQIKSTRVPQSVIDTLLEHVSLVELVKESTHVKSVSGSLVAHCPFHVRGQNSDTLSIDSVEQRFSCLECGFHGSAIGWLMFHDGLSFQDSVFMLAQRSQVDVSEWITPESIESSRLAKRSLLTEIEHFYSEQLSLSSDALSYLHDRGLTDETIQRFGIGFAPGKSSALIDSFPKRSRNLWNQGLLVRLSNGEYGQRFRERIVFPIRDSDGNTVGFGGRALDDSQPKYLNSPSSPTFNKSKLLYGFFEALQSARDGERFILVEGYIDVLALHQAGFDGAIAALGTSPSEHHFQAIFSKSDQLVACFDGDLAGEKAAERLLLAALPHLEDHQYLSFALLPPNQDPDSFIRANGRLSLIHISEPTRPY